MISARMDDSHLAMSRTSHSSSPKAAVAMGSMNAELARWACSVCRARKVKCDRLLPHCSGCNKNPSSCRYEIARKKAVRRSAYKDMVDRLAKMESVVKNLSTTALSPTSPSNGLASDIQANAINSTGVAPPPSRASGLLFFEGNETISKRDPSMPINDSSGSEQTEPVQYSAETDLEVEYIGSFCILSPTGIRWVNNLVGDDLFGREVSTLALSSRPRVQYDKHSDSTRPLPNKEVTIACANEYFKALNRGMPLFDKQEIMDGIEYFYSTGVSPSRGWYVAINVILGHFFYINSKTKDSFEARKYMGNAMSMIPSVITSKPNPLSVGALISMSLFFILVTDNHSSVMVLSTAIQLMVLGGYHIPGRRPGQTEQERLRERRLFWQAFIFDQDLSLQMGKPPMIGQDFTIDLPEERPSDGVGVQVFDEGGITLNYFREQVILAKIQSKVYSSLYSKAAKKKDGHEEIQIISDLDSELCAWKSRIPEITRSTKAPFFDKDPGVMGLTILHYAYYQLIIMIHSFVFQSSKLVQLTDASDRIHSSVALCLGAARARISLLNFHEDSNRFSLHLLNNVSWSLDVVFINILQNKGTPGALEDLKLLSRIISFTKNFDPNYRDAVPFRIASLFYQVACRALKNYANSQNPAPNHIHRPASWHRYEERKTIPPYLEVQNETAPPVPNHPQQSVPSPTVGEAMNSDMNFDGGLDTMRNYQPQLPLGNSFALPTNEQFLNLSLDDPLPMGSNGILNENMAWMGEQQMSPDMQWRLPVGLDPQYWQGLWTDLPAEDEWVQ